MHSSRLTTRVTRAYSLRRFTGQPDSHHVYFHGRSDSPMACGNATSMPSSTAVRSGGYRSIGYGHNLDDVVWEDTTALDDGDEYPDTVGDDANQFGEGDPVECHVGE